MWFQYTPYVSVSERRRKALREMEKLKKKGKVISPVEIDGRTIARNFWGKGWCDHMASFSDFSNRLPRGQTYVRNGSVCHLDIQKGDIQAYVSGSELYTVKIAIEPLAAKIWTAVKNSCAGQVGSLLELLQGKISDSVMSLVCHRTNGLFPQPGQMKFNCSCPDSARMCKHIAAVLYGVGHRLDAHPDLLFTLRGVDPNDLVSSAVKGLTKTTAKTKSTARATIADEKLGALFGIELEESPAAEKPDRKKTAKKTTPRARKPAPVVPPKVQAKAKTKSKPAASGKITSSPKKNFPKKNLVLTGSLVSRLRKKTNLSVEALGEKLGVSGQSIRNWEKNKGKLNLRRNSKAALEAMVRSTQP